MSTDRKWNLGPPPHIGWWNASWCKGEDTWRWWNGHYWSYPVGSDAAMHHIERMASMRDCGFDLDHPSAILWSHYWPENARVPRVDPTKESPDA
jgi:hypothetical protein